MATFQIPVIENYAQALRELKAENEWLDKSRQTLINTSKEQSLHPEFTLDGEIKRLRKTMDKYLERVSELSIVANKRRTAMLEFIEKEALK